MSLAVMMLSLLVWISQVRFPVMRNQIDLVQIQEPPSTLQRIFVDGEQKDCEAHLPRHSVSLSVTEELPWCLYRWTPSRWEKTVRVRRSRGEKES